jgi:hypothetical protein
LWSPNVFTPKALHTAAQGKRSATLGNLSAQSFKPCKGFTTDQERHHRRETFQDEFRRLLRKYGLECEERYVWD